MGSPTAELRYDRRYSLSHQLAVFAPIARSVSPDRLRTWRHFRPAIYRHFSERRRHKFRDLPPPASATVVVSTCSQNASQSRPISSGATENPIPGADKPYNVEDTRV